MHSRLVEMRGYRSLQGISREPCESEMKGWFQRIAYRKLHIASPMHPMHPHSHVSDVIVKVHGCDFKVFEV